MGVKTYRRRLGGEGLPLAATACAATPSSGDTPQRPESLHQPGNLSPTAAQSRPPATATLRKECQTVVKTAPPLALSRPGDRQSPWMMLRTTELAPRRSNTSLPLRFDSVHGSPQGGTPRTSALSKVSPESDQLHRLPPAVRF